MAKISHGLLSHQARQALKGPLITLLHHTRVIDLDIVHIPAHREHLFRFIVNGDSGST